MHNAAVPICDGQKQRPTHTSTILMSSCLAYLQVPTSHCFMKPVAWLRVVLVQRCLHVRKHNQQLAQHHQPASAAAMCLCCRSNNTALLDRPSRHDALPFQPFSFLGLSFKRPAPHGRLAEPHGKPLGGCRIKARSGDTQRTTYDVDQRRKRRRQEHDAGSLRVFCCSSSAASNARNQYNILISCPLKRCACAVLVGLCIVLCPADLSERFSRR